MSIRAVACVSWFALVLTGSIPAVGQESWSSGLLGQELVLVETIPFGHAGQTEPLPASVRERLGPDFVEYESFVAVRLPQSAARELTDAALATGLGVINETQLPVTLPFHTFLPGDQVGRAPGWQGRHLQPEPVPELFLLRFAYPIQPAWLDLFTACGVENQVYLGYSDYLVRAQNLGAIRSCEGSRYLAWAGPYLTTDRLSPALLDELGLDFRELVLQFAPGTTEEEALGELPSTVQVLSIYRPPAEEPASLFLDVLAGAPELEALARTSGRLLAVQPQGEAVLSDERQGQIVAGNHTGTTVTTPGYLTWLTNRGLNTDTNQQTVAVFDTGYDDGTGVTGAHHPDLENPERLVDARNFIGTNPYPTEDYVDTRGHGTFVAGIIAGGGTGTNAKDSQNFFHGLGIAPKSKIVAARIISSKSDCALTNLLSTNRLDEAFQFARTTPVGADKALISNHSWNLPTTTYDVYSMLFDNRVLDADPVKSGLQPMTVIVAVGNRASSDPLDDTILSPAKAKNVISVGSTQSYRPSAQAGAPPLACTDLQGVSVTEDAVHIARVSTFSRRGRSFEPYPGTNVLQVRVKPDLVAPGGRVLSAVPYNTNATYTCPGLCEKYWPDPPTSYHTYSEGTSFAAPVITGAVALKRKWFNDRGANPAPSLLKAALIATADDLGNYFSSPTDHRPSNDFGWGRVDLNRLTDSAARFYVSDNAGLAVGTGTSVSWTRTIDDPSKPTAIVLVWSDPAADTISSEPPLKNDLMITVERVSPVAGWRGNSFNENITGTDNGYSFTYYFGIAGLNDTANTVEAVFLPAGTFTAGQQVTIRITGISVPTGTQKYAIYGYNVRLSS